ncbi:MAG: hypothetical protein ACE5FT_01525 [Candidatus Nanoarchaeia archaeon]
MRGKKAIFILTALLLVSPVFAMPFDALQNQFDPRFPDWRRFEPRGNQFDHRVNLNTIDWFDRGLYFNSLKFQPCVDLEEFYAYADSDKYDRWDREDAENFIDRLDYNDLQRVADTKRGDNIDGTEFKDRDDFKCTRKSSFDDFANKNRGDQWDEDDFYGFIGYPSRQQYDVRTRHFPWEGRYTRSYDGGFAYHFR